MKISFALASLFLAISAQGSAPQVKTQAPGFYRMMVGDIEVTPLFDGFYPMKVKEALAKADKTTEDLLKKTFQGETVPTSVIGFLVNTGTRLILVDAGSGAFFGPDFGKIAANMKAAGYKPEQVDEIGITHMHSDHIGGVVLEGKMAYPNATLRLDQADADEWVNPENEKAATGMMKVHYTNAALAVAPYKAAGKFKPFHGRMEITAGVTAIPNYGHTKGHTAFLVESKGKKLMLVGDTFHLEAVQFADPSRNMAFDGNPKMAVAARKAIFEKAAADGTILGAAHLPFPGLGHVVRNGKGSYRYLPLPYAPVE